MTLADVTPDVRRYLAHDCYCPGEIYETNGFFFYVFSADQECELLADSPERGMAAVTTDSPGGEKILVFYYDSDTLRVEDASMFDATDNNLIVTARSVYGTAVIGRDVIDSVQTAAEAAQSIGDALGGVTSGVFICD